MNFVFSTSTDRLSVAGHDGDFEGGAVLYALDAGVPDPNDVDPFRPSRTSTDWSWRRAPGCGDGRIASSAYLGLSRASLMRETAIVSTARTGISSAYGGGSNNTKIQKTIMSERGLVLPRELRG